MVDLLEDLRKKSGCLYVSDLRLADHRGRAVEEALKLRPEGYTLEQWRGAVRYLLGEDHSSASLEEIQRRLREVSTRR